MDNNLSGPLISAVSPVYRAEGIVDELVRRLKLSLESITDNYEIILVEDGGPDNSWEKIEENCKKDPRVKGIKLSRNFGQHYAITAGLKASTGNWIVVLDCDLQDRPEEIPVLYAKAREGYDTVLAKRVNRQDSWIKKQFSRYFYKVLSYMTNTQQDSTVANFGIYRREVIAAVCSMNDSIRYFPAMVKWVGFKLTSIPVQHAERETGKSSYNFKRAFNLALDVMLAFSDKPLRLFAKLGFIISLISFVFALVSFIRAIIGDYSVLGYASLIISLWFLSGLIIFIIGMVGLYIGKTYEKVKDRPMFIVEEKVNV